MSKRYEVPFYAFYDHTGMVRHYVLSWGDRLAQVTLDEALTPEQMAVIAEKLKP